MTAIIVDFLLTCVYLGGAFYCGRRSFDGYVDASAP